MEKIQKLFETPNFKHHAYGFESHGLRPDDFSEFIDKERFSYVFMRHYDSFLIDDVRAIKSLAVEKTDKESLFIISFTHINSEAQNTLLKLIEEPKQKTTFFFIFPNAKKLLKTIQSRIEIIPFNRVLNRGEKKLDVKAYIKMSLQERFDLSKRLNTKPKKNEDFEKITKEDLQNFLDDLEIFFAKQKTSQKRNLILEKINESRKFMQASSVSIKMIMDNIAINL
jgi:DNA polymerase III delta prime subunit